MSQRRHARCISALLVALAAASAGEESSARPAAVLAPHIILLGVKEVRACAVPLERLKAELEMLTFPSDWVVMIACTPIAWDNAWRRAGQPNTKSAFTSFQARVTVLNGAMFRELRAEYRQSIAHELAHIRCKCADEGRVEQVAAWLLRPPKRRATNAAVLLPPPAPQPVP
jgi:hypothetical protein